jgi:hypothetical protein
MTKEFAGNGCSGWKITGEVFLTVTCGDGGRLSDQRGIGTAGCRELMGEDDGAGLVRYANASVNLRVFLLTAKPPLLTRVCCRNTVGTPA